MVWEPGLHCPLMSHFAQALFQERGILTSPYEESPQAPLAIEEEVVAMRC